MRLLTLFTLTSIHCFAAVTALLQGQLGNQMFEIATAVALARDNGVEATFPGLLTRKDFDIPLNRTQFFFRLPTAPLKGKIFNYKEPTHNYSPIPFRDNTMLIGYYQSEKYFKHHEEEIRTLFAPHPRILKRLKRDFGALMEQKNTVAIHLRTYKKDDPKNVAFYLCSRKYFEEAVALFPEDSVFVVFSDEVNFAMRYLFGLAPNMIFIPKQDYWLDFWLMSSCKHQIISNSTFSWWAAWLNENPEKVVVAPKDWFAFIEDDDIVPESWIVLENLEK